MDTLDICTEYRDKGVVGMDISGDEATAIAEDGSGKCCRQSQMNFCFLQGDERFTQSI